MYIEQKSADTSAEDPEGLIATSLKQLRTLLRRLTSCALQFVGPG